MVRESGECTAKATIASQKPSAAMEGACAQASESDYVAEAMIASQGPSEAAEEPGAPAQESAEATILGYEIESAFGDIPLLSQALLWNFLSTELVSVHPEQFWRSGGQWLGFRGTAILFNVPGARICVTEFVSPEFAGVRGRSRPREVQGCHKIKHRILRCGICGTGGPVIRSREVRGRCAGGPLIRGQ